LHQWRRLFPLTGIFDRLLQLRCTHCGATWQVRRVIGDDYWLKLVVSPAQPDQVGNDLPLRRWYAAMKETISLVPIADTSGGFSRPAVTLTEGERLYLASRRVILTAEADDPLFFGGHGDSRRDKRDVTARRVGPGRLFLTNRRLIWQGQDGQQCELSLGKLNSVYAMFNVALAVLYETRLYQVRFPQESLLKWITYFAYVAKEVKATTGHVITTSNY
jgi:hypothetical protein